MKKTVYELRKNRGAQQRHVRAGPAAPQNRTHQRTKKFSVRVQCAADFPHRVVMVEKLQLELLHRGLYADMKPLDIFKGEFEIVEGHEDGFREIAKEFKFNASEVIVC